MTQDIKPLTKVSPGTVCAAKFSEDEAWYRGIVQSVSANSAQIFFVDYGNSESVSLEFVCNLKPEMMELPALAVKCCLSNASLKSTDNNPDVQGLFDNLVGDKELEVKVVSKQGDTYHVTLFDIVENKDIGSQLQPLLGKKVDPPKKEAALNVSSDDDSAAAPIMPVGSKVNVFLSWVENPGNFWVQQQDAKDQLDIMTEQIQEFYSRPQPIAPSSPGGFIVVRCPDDQMWYRGLVLKELEDDLVAVLYLDYGNSDILPKSELRHVKPEFGKIIPLATRCALSGVRPLRKGDLSWTNDARDFLEKMTEKGCSCEVVGQTDSHRLVKLTVGSKDVSKELIALRVVSDASTSVKGSHGSFYTNKIHLEKSQKEMVTVSHVDSPKSFWCLLNKFSGALNDLMDKLSMHYSDEGGTPLREPAVGQACIVQSKEDSAWYRAAVVKTLATGYEVHLVDYGSNEVLQCNVCQPEPRFLDLPMQAIHCSLSLGADTDNIDVFFDLVLEKDLELEVIDFSNDVVIVELYDSKKKISQMLKAASSTQEQNRKQTSVMQNLVLAPAKTPALNYPIKVFISWVVSPSKFFLQENGIDEALESLMDRIAKKYDNSSKVAPLSNPQVGHPCVALYSEDSLWYRGLITSVSVNQCKVLFVDYGNEETIGVENVRTMLPEIASVPIMAIQCSLSGTEETTWSTSAIEFFEALVMDQEMECVFVTPTVVKLKNSGQDIVSQLVTAGFCKSSTVEMSATQRKPTNEASPWVSPIKQDGGSGRFGGQDGKGKRFNNISKGESDNYDEGHGEKSREFGSRGFSGAPREDSLCISESRGIGRFGGQHEDKRNVSGNRNERDIAFGGREKTSGLRHGNDDFGSSGRQEIKPSSDSASSSSGPREELTYPDPPAEPEKALLTHMDDDGTFYIQLLSMEKDILFLSKRMAGSYKNGGGPRLKETPVKGSVCCAKFPLDGGMYRCVVEDVQGGNVVLRYVDYGNVTESSARDLKMLFADLLQLPVLAFPCKLRGLNWSVQQAEKFAKATLEKKLMVNFITNTTRPYEVDVETPEGDLLGILTGKIEPPVSIISPKASSAIREATSPKKGGFGEKKTSVKSPGHGGFGISPSVKPSSTQSPAFEKSTPSVPKQEFLPQTPPVGENQAYITHLDQDGYFYLQLEKDTALLESFSGVMDANSNLKHPNISVGAACAAVFSEDSAWYRAIICAVADATIQVKFVDYGNGDSVSPSLIAPLSSQLLASAPLAYQCQFLGMGPLSIEASAKLSESYMEHPLTVFFTGTSAPYDVKITTSDGQDLQEILCPSNSYRPKPVPKEVIPTAVCHIEDNGHFYLQLYKDYKDIAELQTCLSAFYNTEPVKSVEKPETGLPCAVKDSDGVWLRSQILQISDTLATIRHVDTGKSTSVELSSLLALEFQFLKQPPFALECCLNDVADRWNESLRAKFTDMTQGKVLNATFHTTTPPLRVSLTRSIELDLLDLAAPISDIPVKTAPVPDSPGKTAPVPDSPGKTAPVPDSPVKTAPFPDSPVKTAPISGSPDKTSLIPDSPVETELISDCSLKTAISDSPVNITLISDNLVETAPISDSPVKTALIRESPATSTSEMNVSKLLTSNSGADGDKIEVYIPHVEADGTFYIQLVAMEDSLNELADKLEGMEVTTLSQVTIGDTVCAKFTEDNVWYRATVESCDPDNQYTVRFVDFGNTDVVSADRLAALSSDLSTSLIPPFTTRCQQTNIPLSVVVSATEKIKELVNNEVVSVKYVTKVSDVQEVDVIIGGKSIVELLDLNVAETQSEVNHEQSDVTESQLKNINTNNSADPDGITSQTSSLLSNISAGQRVTVTVICAVSPDEFYLHLDKDKSCLDTLMNEMYDYFSDMPEEQGLVKNLSVGEMCAALYEDESWYRVRILENLNGTYQVFYIDHGNQETTDASSLRLLPDKFKVQAAYVIKAKLGGVIPVEEGWSDEAVEYFQNFVEAKSLLADIVEINTDNSSCVVHLLKLGIPVHELLIEKGFATLADSSLVDTAVQRHFSDANESTIAQSGDFSYLESTHLEDDESTEQAGTCPVANRGLKIGYVSNTLEELKEVGVYVSHAVSPSLFWCQLSSSSGTLSQISQSMEIAYSSPQNEDKVEGPLSAGDIVAVVSDDGQVYRSKVLSSIDLDSSSDQKVSLRYLDYGNEREFPGNQIYKMKEELCSYPAQAIQCCLDCIQPSEDGWLPEACSKFLEIVEGHELFLKLVGREQDGSVLVDLISTDSDDHVSASLIASGFGEMVGFESATGITSSSLRNTKAADTTGVDALEITQPIMESTVMPGEITQNIQQSYLFEDTENGHYRCLRLSLHTEYEVMVSNDELPNSFHIQLLELRSQFTSLMADIAEHVVSDSNLEPSSFTPEVGACCLVQMCGVWYRGDVLSLEADTWNVKSIDCGWEVKVCQDDLKALPLRFLDLPAQAVPCYLVGIVSVEPQWCSDAIVFFQDCLKETTFCMNVLENANDGKYGVYLSDINQTGTQSINRAMVDLGYAEVVPGSNIDVQIEMEKTLDTDMLNDLEESFNEVSILKCNAHNDDDGEDIDDTVGSDPPSFHEDTLETNQQQTYWEESKVTEEKEIIGESSDVVDFYQMDHGVEIEDESDSIQEGAQDVKGDDDDKEIQRASDVEVGEAVENKDSIEKEADI
ncbi:unnamed protein product [Lymnaea stagnalis]|uniref:Tudor domain-containing protein n=1 Tax=Lymnaea stagnalis TaxID=6523 RepID=A0AAV2IBM5_LYMST